MPSNQSSSETMNKIRRFQKQNLPHNKSNQDPVNTRHIHWIHWSHLIIIIIIVVVAFCLIMGIVHHHERNEAPTQGEKAKTEKVVHKQPKQIKMPKHADSYTRNKIIHENNQNNGVAKINKINSNKKK